MLKALKELKELTGCVPATLAGSPLPPCRRRSGDSVAAPPIADAWFRKPRDSQLRPGRTEHHGLPLGPEKLSGSYRVRSEAVWRAPETQEARPASLIIARGRNSTLLPPPPHAAAILSLAGTVRVWRGIRAPVKVCSRALVPLLLQQLRERLGRRAVPQLPKLAPSATEGAADWLLCAGEAGCGIHPPGAGRASGCGCGCGIAVPFPRPLEIDKRGACFRQRCQRRVDLWSRCALRAL